MPQSRSNTKRHKPFYFPKFANSLTPPIRPISISVNSAKAGERSGHRFVQELRAARGCKPKVVALRAYEPGRYGSLKRGYLQFAGP